MATENGGRGKRTRATIGPSFSGDVLELGGFEKAVVEVEGFEEPLVKQAEAATAMPTVMAAVILTEIGALR